MRKLMVLLVAGGLLLTACGSSAAPAPSKPAAGGGSQAAAGGGSSAPQLNKKLTFVYDSQAGEDDLLSMVAFDQLKQQGWQINNPSLSKNELAVTEVANGQADIATGSPDGIIQADDKGAPLVMIYGYKANAWTVVSKNDIKTVQDLTGKKLGIHSLASFTNAMAHYLIDTYHINPQMPIVPGSNVREQALIKGALDATFLELPDMIDITTKYPDKFHVLWQSAVAAPGIWATILFARKDWVQSHQAELQAVLTEFDTVAQHAAKDPSWLQQQAPKFFPHDEKPVLDKIVKALVDQKVWPTTNEWNEANYQKTVGFYEKYRGLKPAGQPSNYATFDVAAKAFAAAGGQ